MLTFLMLTDDQDHPRIQKRMTILEELYKGRGLTVTQVPLVGASRLEKIFSSLMLADWVTLALAKSYGVDPEPVNMVEEFKKRMG